MTAKELTRIMKANGIDSYEHLLFMAYLTYCKQAKEDESDYPTLSKIEWNHAWGIREELSKRGYFNR